jgi:hypothetical protein
MYHKKIAICAISQLPDPNIRVSSPVLGSNFALYQFFYISQISNNTHPNHPSTFAERLVALFGSSREFSTSPSTIFRKLHPKFSSAKLFEQTLYNQTTRYTHAQMPSEDKLIKKKAYVARLAKYFEEYQKLLIVTADNVGSSLLQKIRQSVRPMAEVVMGKNVRVPSNARGFSAPFLRLIIRKHKKSAGNRIASSQIMLTT